MMIILLIPFTRNPITVLYINHRCCRK